MVKTGEKIRKLMKEQGLTYKELAKKADLGKKHAGWLLNSPRLEPWEPYRK